MQSRSQCRIMLDSMSRSVLNPMQFCRFAGHFAHHSRTPSPDAEIMQGVALQRQAEQHTLVCQHATILCRATIEASSYELVVIGLIGQQQGGDGQHGRLPETQGRHFHCWSPHDPTQMQRGTGPHCSHLKACFCALQGCNISACQMASVCHH